jgi:type I restriction enzyme, S subunit
MNRYPAYKDSGVEWIGEVPESWYVEPVKYSAAINSSVLRESNDPDFEFHYIDIGNVSSNGLEVKPKRIKFGDSPSRARRIVKIGDTIISTVRTYLKAIHFIEENENQQIASTGFAVLSPRDKLQPKFLFHVLSNQSFIDTVCKLSTGVSYPAINASELARIPVWFPKDKDEQRKIVSYLDHKTHSIDTLIEKKQRQIELLQEQRAAIINQAVTKGLDSNVKMKDSGVEWIGEVPESWEVTRLKYKAHLINGYAFSSDSYVQEGIPIIRIGDLKQTIDLSDAKKVPSEFLLTHRAFEVKKGDVLLALTGATIGKSSFFDIPEAALLNQRVAILRSQEYMNRDFLRWLIGSACFQRHINFECYGGAQENIGRSEIGNFCFALPPVSVQSDISNYLEQQAELIDSLVDKTCSQIEVLQEYRTTLISEVVTGKIDVREEVIPDGTTGTTH